MPHRKQGQKQLLVTSCWLWYYHMHGATATLSSSAAMHAQLKVSAKGLYDGRIVAVMLYNYMYSLQECDNSLDHQLIMLMACLTSLV